MTWRMQGLTRRMWNLSGKASAKCCEGCADLVLGKSPRWAGRLAREHTRQTGHVTRTAHVKVTEYRRSA